MNLCDRGIMTGGMYVVSVTEVIQLQLITTDCQNSINNNHDDWANARMIN